MTLCIYLNLSILKTLLLKVKSREVEVEVVEEGLHFISDQQPGETFLKNNIYI